MAKKDYRELSEKIVTLVGGTENIKTVTHCMTRLRFSLIDEEKANQEKLEKTEGVLKIVRANNQYQVVIGQEVNPIYATMLDMYHFDGDNQVVKETVVKKKGLKAIGAYLLDYITGSVTQLLPVLIGAGLMLMLPTIAYRGFGFSNTSSTYLVLNSAANAAFYFLPAFIGFAAAKKLNCNPFMAALLGVFTLQPTLIATLGAEGGANLFGLAIPNISYASGIFPALLSTFVYSYVEKFLYAKLPKYVKSTFAPFISMIVMIPLVLFILGPIGYNIGAVVVNGVLAINNFSGWLGAGLLSALMFYFVMVGAHSILIPIMVSMVADGGIDTFLRPSFVICCFSVFGVTLACAAKAKDKNFRGMAFGAAISQFFGVGEPAMYGVILPLKKPLIIQNIAAFIGGITYHVFGCAAIAPGTNGVFGLLIFNKIPVFALICAITAGLAFVGTYFIKIDYSSVEKA